MNISEVKRRISQSKYKVISFDIFDTLLLRPCLRPTDLLKLVGLRCGYEGNFLEMRRAAEKKARKECRGEEIQYDEIYQAFMGLFSFTEQEIEAFKKTELDIEMQYLYARKAVKELFDFALSTGKRVILVSDMYLPRDFIVRILEKNGYTGFQKIYLSSEYGKTKSTGHLYDVVLDDCADLGIAPYEILHMGDHERSDVAVPEGKNMKSIFLPRTSWLLQKNKKLKKLCENMERKLDNTFLIGFSANLVFNDPFRPYNRETYFYGSRYSAANMLFAPFVFSFVKWMLEDCVCRQVDTLCMVYRDGYIPEKMLEYLNPCYENAPQIVRLYLTRAMINRFYGTRRNGLLESIHDMLYSDTMTVQKFIKERLYVTDESQYQEILQHFFSHHYKDEKERVGRRDELSTWLKELNVYFEQNTRQSIHDIKAYCVDTLKGCGRLAVYDVGYRGSVCTFLREQVGIDSVGYHLFAKENLRYTGSANENFQYGVMYGLLTEKETRLVNGLTEELLNAREASVNNVLRLPDGSYHLCRDGDRKENEAIEKLQTYMLQYVKGFTELFQRDLRLLHFDITNYFEFYRDFLIHATSNDTKLFRQAKWSDSSFMNPYAENIYKQWEMEHRFKKKSERVLFEMQESVWELSAEIPYRLYPTLILAGNPKTISEQIFQTVNKIKEETGKVAVHLLMETTQHSISEYREWKDCSVNIISKIEMRNGYDANINIDVSDDMQKLMLSKSYLTPLVQQLYDRHPDMGKGYPEALVCYWYAYFYKVISLYNQEQAKAGFLIWDEESVMHRLLKEMCCEYGIPAAFVNDSFLTLSCRNILKEIKEISEKKTEKKHMRIAICASMPRKGYSGGRTHALNLAECLAHEGNEVYFISRYLPMFVEEMKDNQGHRQIHFIGSEELKQDKTFFEKIEDNYFDYLILVPHRDKNDEYYKWARSLAKRTNAKLVLLNYETPNWIYEYLKEKQDEAYWKPWRDVCQDGCLVLCSDKESMKYARKYFVDIPEYTKFDYWYPTINSIEAEKVQVEKENTIVAFVRPGDKNKGTDDVLQLLDERLKDYKVVLIYGRGVKDAAYFDFVRKLQEIENRCKITIELKIQPSDYEKFVEISKAKIMLFPSYFEGYGTPPIEAQYCNTVCLVYDLPVLRETCKDGVIYCEYGNVEDMREKLTTLMGQDCYPADLHKNVYEIANFEACSKRLNALFRSYLKEDWRRTEK